MKIKNEYVKIKQGKNEVELHNLILDKYLSLFASSVLETKYKGLNSCLINCTIQEEITPSMDAMHWDFYLNEQNLYNNSDYKGASKIITKYLYEPNFKEQIQSFIGQKILSIGFAQMVEEPTLPDGSDATFELYAILDVSNYNLYVQDMQEFVVERVDTVTTDMVFSSDTEKFPIHLSPRGNSYFDQQEETGTREVGILKAIGKGYNSMFPTALMPKSNFNITRNENEIDITGLSIQENTGEELYPSNELYSKKKWSEEIQKSEKGSEVIIEGNNKEAFVDIEGKSEQETRSGKNLLNVTATSRTYDGTLSVTVNDDKSITLNGTNTSGETIYYRLGDNFTLSVGTYTLSNHNDNCNPSSTYGFYDDGNNFDRTKTSTKTFSNTVTIKPYIRINAGITVNNQTIYPMIEQGSSMTDYEQYGVTPSPSNPSEIHSVAELSSLVINHNGKNKQKNELTTGSQGGISYVINQDKSITLNGINTSGSTIFLRLSPNYTLLPGTYTLSNHNSNVNGNTFSFYDDGGNFTTKNNYETKTFNSSITIKPYIRIANGITLDNETIYPMIEESSSMTNYEPYFNEDYTIQTEPLRSLPNGVKDTIEVDGIHRRVGIKVFDGSENTWELNKTLDKTIRFRNWNAGINSTGVNNLDLVSDYFIQKKWYQSIYPNLDEEYMAQSITNDIYFSFNKGFLPSDTLEGLKTWLSSNPVTVLYPLAEEIIEPLTEEQMEVLRSIQTFEGYNNFTTTDDLQPVIQVTEYENCIYPQKAQMNWIFYEFSVYKFIDTVTGYQDTGRKYCEAKNTTNSGNLNLKIKYERR